MSKKKVLQELPTERLEELFAAARFLNGFLIHYQRVVSHYFVKAKSDKFGRLRDGIFPIYCELDSELNRRIANGEHVQLDPVHRGRREDYEAYYNALYRYFASFLQEGVTSIMRGEKI